jgi:hypothetical protein
MSTVRNVAIAAALGVTGLVISGTQVRSAFAKGDQQVQNERSHAIAQGEDAAKQLLLLMDRDKNGKVSREEFTSFMEAEFNRLDKDKNGELDVNELLQSQIQAREPFTLAGK